jgi:hypothetical protein
MRKALVVVGVLAAALMVTGIAVADHNPPDGSAVPPVFIAGKVSNECEDGQKIDGSGGDVVSGNYTLFFPELGDDGATMNLTITVVQTDLGPTFTFVSTSGELVTSIWVKGGPDGSNLYDYGAGILHDDGLHSPVNPNNKQGKYYGLSHLCISADKI